MAVLIVERPEPRVYTPGRSRWTLPYVPIVAALTLLAAVLRLHTLADANPWFDEGFTAWLASFDVPGMLLRTASDTHPPLSYLLYQGWQAPAGRSIYALRYLSVVFGVLSVPLCAAAARRLGGRFAGFAAAGLLAVSRFHIWWSQQIRMYALVALLCALSIYLVLRALEAHKRSGWLVAAAGLANLLALYTLYFSAVLVALESALVLLTAVAHRRGRLLGVWAGVHLAALALLAPWLVYFRQHAIQFPPSGETLTFGQFASASWSELTLGIDTNVSAYLPLLAGLAALALVLLALAGRRRPVQALWLAAVAGGLPLAAYGVTRLPGLFFSAAYQTRYDLPALPALVVLLAFGASLLPSWTKLAPLAVYAGVAVFVLPPFYADRHRTDDYQSLARFVQAYERPGDVLLFDPDKNFHLFLLDYGGSLPWEAFPLNQPVDAAYANQQFSRWTAEYQAIWLVQESGGHDAGAAQPVKDWLRSHLQETLQLTVGDRLLALYQPATASARTVNAGFKPEFMANDVQFDQPLNDVRPGDLLELAVYGAQLPSAVRFGGASYSTLPLAPPITVVAASRAPSPAQGAAPTSGAIGVPPGAAYFSIPVSPAVPSGQQPIEAVYADGRSKAFSSVYVEPHAAAASGAVEPELRTHLGARFGTLTELTSYELALDNGQLTVKLQWRDLAPFSANYTVFVHLLDASGKVVAQQDSQPVDGARPTIQWQPGQVIDDQYVLDQPQEAQQLELGLYLQATGERLELADGSDRVLLPLSG
ncbi:MAG: glycosyltransferase family 39 protein [Chloroflexi bacterium]|nr:glycosyltransferase family 39 protein [Chloroflexota bacterium]